jgi:hypothetical protein
VSGLPANPVIRQSPTGDRERAQREDTIAVIYLRKSPIRRSLAMSSRFSWTRWLTYSGVPTTIISPRVQRDIGFPILGPVLSNCLPPPTSHFFESETDRVTVICDTEAPLADQDAPTLKPD